MITFWEEAEAETERARVRRRRQQRRCLVCGGRQLVNNQTSYFCAEHFITHRYCGVCETLRLAAEHGADWRCRSCSAKRALAYYYANAERNIYRIRLKKISTRKHTRADQIFIGMRRRIALARLVAATPGWSWARRASIYGGEGAELNAAYRRQCAGLAYDADRADVLRRSQAHER